MKSIPKLLLTLFLIQPLHAGDWTSLFDGKTLNGFTQRGGIAKYTVDEESILGTTVPNTPNSFLCTNKDFENFILELEFKVDPRMNSGIQFRSESKPEYKNGIVHGYQSEIDPSQRAWTAGIYEESRRGWLANLEKNEAARAAFKQNEWNKVRIEAIGNHLRTFLNEVPAADLIDDMTAKGFIALQVHGIGKKDEQMQVRWRNIRLMENPTPTDLKPANKFNPINTKDIVPAQVEVRLIQNGFKFTEGPALAPDGRIYFSDIPNARIHIYDPTTDKVTVHRENSGGANGLMFMPDGSLLACEMKNRRLTSEIKGEIKVLAETCNGKRFNQTNDVDLDGKGGIYFTDPNYGQKEDIQMDKECVYYIAPGSDKAILVVDDCLKPNGVIVSLDKKNLYVGDNGANKIRVYDIEPDGTVKNGRDFAKMAPDKTNGGDGITLDEKGNLYVTAQEFVWIFNPQGNEIAKIKVPEDPANCVFGRNNILYITARTGFYAVKLNVGGPK